MKKKRVTLVCPKADSCDCGKDCYHGQPHEAFGIDHETSTCCVNVGSCGQCVVIKAKPKRK